MKNKQIFEDILNKYQICIETVVEKYNEPHRFYHNLDHIDNLIDEMQKHIDFNNQYIDQILLTIIFHDIVYDPHRNDNEIKSAEFFNNLTKNVEISNKPLITTAILDTEKHIVNNNNIVSEILCTVDMSEAHF